MNKDELVNLCREALRKRDFFNKKILVIIPDTTRTGPINLFFRTICDELSDKSKKSDFIIALGTHPLMDEERINEHLGISSKEKRSKYKDINIFQHRWDKPEELREIGVITKEEVKQISNGLMNEEIPVQINKRIFDYDELLIVGAVFPHEVVGFSGGHKYLFPGIAGPRIIHKFHWLGALMTNLKINGVKNTPVREVINKAVSFIHIPITMFCFVMKEKEVSGFYAGGEEAWSKAADLSSTVNIKYLNKSFRTVLSMAPKIYEDLWTAGKCMYKLEPVVEEGGTLIIYAPHIEEISSTHGRYIEKIGYHIRDYFLKQWDKFKDIPGAVLAHCTHVKGIGTYENGKEVPRIKVILSTGISEEKCRKINLGYINPSRIKMSDYADKEDKNILLVKNAGEVLYRMV